MNSKNNSNAVSHQQLEMQLNEHCYVTMYKETKDSLNEMEEEMKKIYHQVLTMNFDLTCLQMELRNVKNYAENNKIEEPIVDNTYFFFNFLISLVVMFI